jgi:RNA polymerase sigma-70 factor, ECF subfamily
MSAGEEEVWIQQYTRKAGRLAETGGLEGSWKSQALMELPDRSGESALIKRLRSRDPEALTAAYDHYGELAYSLIARVTHDPAASEDLVQELFMRLWNRAHELDSNKGSLKSWLLSVARNMAIDHIRSAQWWLASRTCSIDYVDTPGSHPGAVDSRIDSARAIRTAFAKLGSVERQVLELAYFEGLSQSEIAAKLGHPLGTIKSWMRSALDHLRAAVTGAGTT